MSQPPKRPRGRPPTTQGTTPVRTVRLGPIWDDAETCAHADGETMRDVLERLLPRYVAAWHRRQRRDSP